MDHDNIIFSHNSKIINWKNEQEEILKKWGDKALCYKIMHDKAYKKYWCLNAWFNIPIIILSTVSGAINFSSSNFNQYKNEIIIISGAMNIFTGIIGTISSYIGISKKVEGHRIASLSWDKFSRRIQIELSKQRNDRVNVEDFIKICSDEYDRLIEISPILGDDIIRWMKEFIEWGELEESNIISSCLCIYDLILFPCNCGGILYCCRRNNNIKNDKNMIIFKNIDKPEILGYIQPIKIAKVIEEITSIEKKSDLEVENEYAMYSFSRNNEIL
jgi:hypothetical protein